MTGGRYRGGFCLFFFARFLAAVASARALPRYEPRMAAVWYGLVSDGRTLYPI